MSVQGEKIRCSLITLAPFPIGNVSTIRYTSYLQELVKEEAFVKVYILAPTKMAVNNHSKKGCFKGIHFQYLTKITWLRVPNFLSKMYYYLVGLLLSVKYLQKDNINCLILYHQETFAYVFYWFVTRFLNITYITDKSEYPYGYSKMSRLKRKIEHLKLRVFDGFIVITEELTKFYSKHKASKAKVLHLPMTIDPDRYCNSVRYNPEYPYISVVFGIHNRDGLFESVQAYGLYKSMSPHKYYKLFIIGDFDKLPNRAMIDEFINNQGLTDDVVKLGLLPIDNVPQILFNSCCLLTTPNEYVSGGFPTKLGEYMLSGVPIVATSVGEIPNYLTDKKDVYLSPPGDISRIANLLLYVQNNSEIAQVVGRNAITTAKTIFNARNYSTSLIEFINGFFDENS